MQEKMNILIMGKQGSGKGTQAELIAQKYKLTNISTGAMFREAIVNQTELGLKVKEILSAGKLVSDNLTGELVLNKLKLATNQLGFILDGFPRNIIQAEFIAKNFDLTYVLEIYISDLEAVRRIAGRLMCACGMSYHKEFNPPKQEGICDKCGKKIEVREDDKEEAVKKRLQIYHKQTKPVLDFFREKNIYFKINGEQNIPDVSRDIFAVLENNHII